MGKTKKIISFIIVFLAMPLNCVYSDGFTKKTISAYASFIPAEEPKVIHEQITSVIDYLNVFNAKVKLEYSNEYTFSQIKLFCYYDDDPSKTESITDYKEITADEFYIGIDDKIYSSEHKKINYKIEVTFLEYGSEEKKISVPESDYYVANVISAFEADIDGSTGGTLTITTGNQNQADINVVVLPGAYEGTNNIKIDFSYDSILSAVLLVQSLYSSAGKTAKECIADWSLSPDLLNKVTLNKPISISNAAFENEPESAKQYVLQYKPSDTEIWKNTENNGNLKIDFTNNTFSCEMMNFGYYRIIIRTDFKDSDFRPKKRAIIKSKEHNGFEFPNLQDGDTLKIFNVNGKKVREITKRTNSFDGFVWDGRNDSGTYVKSGIYIYQIKKADGKRINGTIVFAK